MVHHVGNDQPTWSRETGASSIDPASAAVAAEFQQPARLVPHVLDRAVGQRPLRGQPAVERQPAAVLRQQRGNVHHLRLEGIEAVQPDGRPGRRTARPRRRRSGSMTNLPASRTAPYIRCSCGIDELAPQPGPHLQAALLAPVVAEVDRVDVVFDLAIADLKYRKLTIADEIQRDRRWVERFTSAVRYKHDRQRSAFTPQSPNNSIVIRIKCYAVQVFVEPLSMLTRQSIQACMHLYRRDNSIVYAFADVVLVTSPVMLAPLHSRK